MHPSQLASPMDRPCLSVSLSFLNFDIHPMFSALKDTPTSCIQKLFPIQKAFCFRSPHVEEEDGEIFPQEGLHPVFHKQLGSFKDYIFRKSPRNSLGNTFVTGKGEFGGCFLFTLLLSLPPTTSLDFIPFSDAYDCLCVNLMELNKRKCKSCSQVLPKPSACRQTEWQCFHMCC